MTEPAPPNAGLLRFLAAGALAAAGVALVWQGFGLAGYGTDAHFPRVLSAFVALHLTLWLAVRPRTWRGVRVTAALLGLGAAGYAWWAVKSSETKSAVSLRDACVQRDELRQLFARPLDDVRGLKGTKAWVERLNEQYPTLTAGTRDEFVRWVEDEERATAEKVRLVSTTDTALAKEWSDRMTALRDAGGPGRAQHDAVREWLQRARRARDDELRQVPPGDWAGFDRTAPGRRAFADAFGGIRAFVVVSEDAWGNRTAHDAVARAGPRRAALLETEKALLALQSVETGTGRFAAARQILFRAAHEAAQAEVAAHLDAGRYADAFGLARAHAVGWDATAVALGEANKLDALRDYCEAFARLSEVSAAGSAEVAPPPRPKPE